jgi:rod shape-determining protein MreD
MKRVLPSVIITLALLMDVCVLPVFTRSWWFPSIALIIVNCYGILLGRTRGLWYGLLAGVIIDITVMSPIGLWTFAFVATGYFSGFFNRLKRRYILAPLLSAFACRTICELMFLLYGLLASAQLEPGLALHVPVRVSVEMLLVSSMAPLIDVVLKPSRSRYAARKR